VRTPEGAAQGGDMGSVAMFWVTRASIHAELILVDDHDGREMAFKSVLAAPSVCKPPVQQAQLQGWR
jgi:hypothetical protein